MFQEKTVKYNLRRSKLIRQPKFLSQTYGYHSLRQEGTRLWDTFPNICKDAKDVNANNCEICKLILIWFLTWFLKLYSIIPLYGYRYKSP